jgi:hypothetical protein
MNQYRETLKAIAIGGLVLGGLIIVIALLFTFGGGGPGALTGVIIGSTIFSLGITGLFFWLLAESIAHGQRALIQTIQMGKTEGPSEKSPTAL